LLPHVDACTNVDACTCLLLFAAVRAEEKQRGLSRRM